MLTTRRAFCAHLRASGLFQTVAPMASEEDLARTSVELPACFVAYQSGSVSKKEDATLHVFVPGFAHQLAGETAAATDALGLTEEVASYLTGNHFWQNDEGRTWQIDLSAEEGLTVRAGRFRDKHAFYVLAVPVKEV